MKKYLLQVLAAFMIVTFVLPTPLLNVKAADRSYLDGLTGGEKLIAEAVYNGFTKKADTLSDEVITFTRPKMEEISKVIQTKMLENKSIFEGAAYQQPDLSAMLSELPPQSALAMIPPQGKAAAIAKAQESAGAQIRESFAGLPTKIEAEIGDSINTISATMNDEVKEMIKTLLFDIADLIDTQINESIEAEIEAVLPSVIDELPDDMQDMSPEEIAVKYEEKIRPAAESALRPAFEAQMRAAISQLAKEIIEDPINQMVNPQLISVDSDACLSVMNQIPSYLTEFVPESFVKATVDAEVAKLNAALPAMIDEQQKNMQAEIKKTIDDFIDTQSKLYINGKLSNIQVNIINSNQFLNWNSTLKAIGAKSKYNSKKKIITVTKGDTTVEFTLGSRTIKVNGKVMKNELDKGEQPQMVNKMPVLPAKEVAELFGYECDYNEQWGMTTIGVMAAGD